MSNTDGHKMPDGYHERLYNEDLAPLSKTGGQTWNWYNIFAFWMSDVHSVGGYIFAASLFALGLASWQVFVALIAGICIVQYFTNLVAKPSQITGAPYPVMCRTSFGILGANIPAIIRGLIAVAWYGIQTYLASAAFVIVVLRFMPELSPYATDAHTFLGLHYLGWFGFLTMWVLQALVFWNGMEAIKKFIDLAGPAVYVVMVLLAIWIVHKAGWENITLDLGGNIVLSPSEQLWEMIIATALVVSYFSGPVLNFGDFSRYGKTFDEVKRGNFWGLPVNFVFFSLVTVITTAGTLPVFGEMINDPIETVGRIDSTFAALLGAFTFITATIGINIVANFVSPAFDFSNVAPKHISWRTGGMIAAVGSVFITPWNLFNNPEIIHYTLDVLASFIGPLFGILLIDFYWIKREKVIVDDLYILGEKSSYWYKNGVNPAAVKALIPSVAVGLIITFTPGFMDEGSAKELVKDLASFAWFTGVVVGGLAYRFFAADEIAAAKREAAAEQVA